MGTLSLMRLDGDFYESTRDGLKYLYDKLSIGGASSTITAMILGLLVERQWTNFVLSVALRIL